MRARDVRRLLLSVPAPDELAAQRRTWAVVRSAFEAREHVPRPRRHVRPLAGVALACAVVAGILTPPGRAFLDSVREAIAPERVRGVERAQPALFRLPAPGRLLVHSVRGPWVVRREGGKRLLGRYRVAAWSPHGIYVVASRRFELAALEPGGDVRWSLPRRGTVTAVAWTGDRRDTRIAYLSDENVRVVAGDGTGDRLLRPGRAPRAFTALAWRPGSGRLLAVSDRTGRVAFVSADTSQTLWQSRPSLSAATARRGAVSDRTPFRLDWSPDGRRLAVLAARSLRIFSAQGRLVGRAGFATRAVDMEFAPRGRRLALVRRSRARSEVLLVDGDSPQGSRKLFSGPGRMTDVAWSPDGRWLLIGWQSADQWIFVRIADGAVRAVSNVSRQFHSPRRPATFPETAPDGWCCAAR